MRRRTGAHWVALAVALLCANQARAQRPWECPEQPIEPCVKRHGRLSSQNGITRTIWIIGTTRRVAVANDFESFPPILQKYLMMTSDDHSSIFGDFEICLTRPDVPGRIMHACVAGGEKLVVQPLRRRESPFRLLSTWPSDAR
jgi:hypothetical protein